MIMRLGGDHGLLNPRQELLRLGQRQLQISDIPSICSSPLIDSAWLAESESR